VRYPILKGKEKFERPCFVALARQNTIRFFAFSTAHTSWLVSLELAACHAYVHAVATGQSCRGPLLRTYLMQMVGCLTISLARQSMRRLCWQRQLTFGRIASRLRIAAEAASLNVQYLSINDERELCPCLDACIKLTLSAAI
jgi:hypothetical protein